MSTSGMLVACILICFASVSFADLVEPITITENVLDPKYDVVIFINDNLDIKDEFPEIYAACNQYKYGDSKVGTKLQLIPFLKAPGKGLIFSPTGSLTYDTADSRLIYNAGRSAIQLMQSIGKRKPLIVVGPMKSAASSGHLWLEEPYLTMTTLLGAYQAVYTPLTIRRVKKTSKYDYIGIYKSKINGEKLAKLLPLVMAVEEGRMIARDICGTDQEQMTAVNVESYLNEHFTDKIITTKSVKVTDEWPLMAAVDRVNKGTPYEGRVITMDYKPEKTNPWAKDLYLVGKGIIFDTGGLSLKTGGYMTFMHSDKCGAAAVAGFMKIASIVKPKNVMIHAKMAYVRNNIGPDAYAVDEIITSKAGVRSRIGSTDAEGRNVLVDLITDCVHEIRDLKDYFNAHIITIATLTGHVGMAFGHLTAVMDNGPAHKQRLATELSDSGMLLGDLAEVSRLRREDYENCYSVTQYEQLQQRNTHPDTVTYRGHQYPAAWMIMASGLYNYSEASVTGRTQIKYTHMDVASSVGVDSYEMPTAAPIPMLFAYYILPETFPLPGSD